MNEREIFEKAAEFTSPKERGDFINRACQGDQQRADYISSLLEERLDSFLEQPVRLATQSLEHTSSDLESGRQIGPYKLLEVIGEGGMGTVYMADQTEPVRRRVAVKVIKAGMDTRQIIGRFEVERQALALMDHPNISKVLDAGSTETGHPYFVMELVKGTPITEFCDKQHLGTRERLQLFQQVCHAVQHAHQKGIIHRDIKPTNVLVAMYDDQPVSKVIDFGVAKATGEQLTEKTMFTHFGQVVGTLPYMSPEQAQFNQSDIDTRSDIYSLGAILYELLVGEPLFDQQRLKSRSLDESMRMIREEEPTKPSARLSSTAQLAEIASNRHTTPEKLSSQVRGDLDWIVMKAIDKDRSRRYETANGLALDLDRYLKDEPVLATPPSSVYRILKMAKRNRSTLIVASLLLLGISIGLIGTTYGMFRALDARDQLATQKRYADAIVDFVKTDFLELSTVEGQWNYEHESNDEYESIELSKDSTLRDLLDRAAKKLESRTDLDPHTEAELSQILGISYRRLGEYDRAIELLTKSVDFFNQAYGESNEKSLKAKNSLALAYDNSEEAVPLLAKSLGLSANSLGRSHPVTLALMSNLAARSGEGKLAISKQAYRLAEAELGLDDPETLRLMGHLAVAYAEKGQLDKSVSLLSKTVELQKTKLGINHPLTLANISNLGEVYREQGQINKAIELVEESLELQRSVLEPDHPKTLSTLKQLADAYQDSARFTGDKAQFESVAEIYEEILAASKRSAGRNGVNYFNVMNELALTRNYAGQFDVAIPLFAEALDWGKKNSQKSLARTLMGNLALAYGNNGEFDKSISLSKETIELSKAADGIDDPSTLRRMTNLGITYWRMNRLDDSIPAFVEVVEIQKRVLGPDHPSTLISIAILAVNYRAAGRLDEAVPLLEEVTTAEAVKKNFDLFSFRVDLIEAYVELNNAAKSPALAEDHLKFIFERLPEDSPRLATELARLCRIFFLKTEDFDKTEELLRKCVAIRKGNAPDHWTTFNAISLLGEALMHQQKLDEAETCLVNGYYGMVERAGSIPVDLRSRQNLPESLHRVVTYYESRLASQPGKDFDNKAQQWRRKLEELRETEKAATKQDHAIQ